MLGLRGYSRLVVLSLPLLLACAASAQVKIGIVDATGASPAQVALAWLLAQKPWIVPIPGTRRLERLEENIGAAAVELTSEDLREIENAIAQITVVGNRY